jgi:hypothetical protein
LQYALIVELIPIGTLGRSKEETYLKQCLFCKFSYFYFLFYYYPFLLTTASSPVATLRHHLPSLTVSAVQVGGALSANNGKPTAARGAGEADGGASIRGGRWRLRVGRGVRQRRAGRGVQRRLRRVSGSGKFRGGCRSRGSGGAQSGVASGAQSKAGSSVQNRGSGAVALKGKIKKKWKNDVK